MVSVRRSRIEINLDKIDMLSTASAIRYAGLASCVPSAIKMRGFLFIQILPLRILLGMSESDISESNMRVPDVTTEDISLKLI